MFSFPRILILTITTVGSALAQATSNGASSGSSGDKPAPTTGGSSGEAGKGGAGNRSAAAADAKIQNGLLQMYGMDLLIALISVVVALAVYRMVTSMSHHIRMLACLTNNTQRYFAIPHETWSKIKKDIIYAPMFRTRHNREFRLSSAINMGTLPTRFQFFLMMGILAMNVTFCVYRIPFMNPDETSVLKYLRNRTGTIAVTNLIPLVIMADRNNIFIKVLNISFDSFNMFHRFFGRLVVSEAIAHTLCWVISDVNKDGWGAIGKAISHSKMIMTGFVGVIALTTILLQSPSPIRHAFYEVFLHLHIGLAAVVFAFVYIHLDGLPQQAILFGTIVAWASSRVVRLVNVVYRNVGRGGTKATIELLPGEAMRITFRLARSWNFKPGQHMYVTIPSVGLWTSHPFTVAWSDVETPISKLSLELDPEKGTSESQISDVVLAQRPTYVSAIVRRRTGFTDHLYKKAEKSNAWNGMKLTLNAFVEGPFGLSRPMTSYGTVLLFAGGVGITHQVPYVRSLVAGYHNGTVAARRLLLVWVIQSPEHLEWIRPWMTQILNMESRRDVLRIQLFITRPRSAKEVHSPSSTVQMFPGRPSVETLMQQECENAVGCMGVSVCGTGELQDEVRRCVRGKALMYNVEYVEESFSW